MRYLTGTQEEIDAINCAEATERGCNGTTTMWYATQTTADGQACLMIDDDKMIDGSTEVEPEWPVVELQ